MVFTDWQLADLYSLCDASLLVYNSEPLLLCCRNKKIVVETKNTESSRNTFNLSWQSGERVHYITAAALQMLQEVFAIMLVYPSQCIPAACLTSA